MKASALAAGNIGVPAKAKACMNCIVCVGLVMADADLPRDASCSGSSSFPSDVIVSVSFKTCSRVLRDSSPCLSTGQHCHTSFLSGVHGLPKAAKEHPAT